MFSKIAGITRFNLRVYAIIEVDNRVLLCDERMGNYQFTKFPGGGVEPGEGILDALRRELHEELSANIKTSRHFYTTDFFQQSAFKAEEQVVSIYYRVQLENLPLTETAIQFGQSHFGTFYFTEIISSLPDQLTFPIDKIVGRMLYEQCN